MTLPLNSNNCLAEKEGMMLSRGKGSCHTEGKKEKRLITSAFIYFLYQAHTHTSMLEEQWHTGNTILESGPGKWCLSGAPLACSKRAPQHPSAVPNTQHNPRAPQHRQVNSSASLINRQWTVIPSAQARDRVYAHHNSELKRPSSCVSKI